MNEIYKAYKYLKRNGKDIKKWIDKLSLEEKQMIVIGEFDRFYQMNLFNKYMAEDEIEFRKQLEEELNVEIDLNWKVKEVKN